ncbi:inositol-tetrakisphosphate 1-kinase-like [Uloborus diversus]|uniref:inositol-tetrakisphosphate 1-kinase-like n=1 Tax=Uloborus diversus TaxID=327109 RepID=UPI0024093B0B|nr:inositol-tetrakisphosphate 1-kinase-like [Uloborus diversus]
MGSKRPLRVGYWWSSKKSLKFKYTEFADVCRKRGIDLVKLDLERPLEEQGPLDAIVHKLTNVMLEAEAGDPWAINACRRFREYVSSRPDLVVVDPLDKVEVLLNRYNQYTAVQENRNGQSGEEEVFVPAFVELHSRDVRENLSRMRARGIRFPIVCKPLVAHGTPVAHEVSSVFLPYPVAALYILAPVSYIYRAS